MMTPQYNLFDSQKYGNLTDDDRPLFNAEQLEDSSQQMGEVSTSMPLPRVVMNLHGSLSESDDDDERAVVDLDGLSLVYKNDEEHGDDASDMNLSFVYRPQAGGWEDEEGMVLSANPAWMQLLGGDNLTTYHEDGEGRNSSRGNEGDQEFDPHRRRSFLSVNSSQKSGGNGEEEGRRSRRRSFMTVSSAGGSDIVAVKAGRTFPSITSHFCTHALYSFVFLHTSSPLLLHTLALAQVEPISLPCKHALSLTCTLFQYISGGAYFPAAAAYVAAASAAAAAVGFRSPQLTNSVSKNNRVFPSTQQYTPNLGADHTPLNADDLFNKQLKKAADDFIPEHTIEDAEAPKSTPTSPQPSVVASPVHSPERSPTVRNYSYSLASKESGSRTTEHRDRDRDHAMDFTSVYEEPGSDCILDDTSSPTFTLSNAPSYIPSHTLYHTLTLTHSNILS